MAIKAKRIMKRRNTCSCSMPGVWRALCYVDGAVVIFHSPRACAHIARRMDINSYYRNLRDAYGECSLKSVPLLSSDLEEDEAVFGGENRLRRAIRYAAEKYHPKAIFIANSCVSGVIGDDTEAVAAELEEELGIAVAAVSAHGYLDGEYFAGYIDTARMLIDRFMQPQPKKPGTVMLLGDCGGVYGEYVQQVKRLLGYFSLRVTAHFPSFIPIDQLAEAPSASLTIVLGRYKEDERQKELVKLAEHIQERFAIPYIGDVYPVGFEQTKLWLQRVGGQLGKPALAKKAIASEEAAFAAAIDEGRQVLAGKKVVYCVGRLAQYFQPEIDLALLQRLGIELLGVQLFDCYPAEERLLLLQRLQACTAAPVLDEQAAEAAMRQADFVLTTHELLSADIKQVYTLFLPGAGWCGERDLLRAMERLVCRRPGRGGLVYA